MQVILFNFIFLLMNFMSNLFILLLLIKFQVNICGYLFILLLLNFIFYVEIFICFHMCLRFFLYLILLLCLELIFFLVFELISIFILTLFLWVWFLHWNFYYLFFLYCTWQIKHLIFFVEKSTLQPMSFNLGNDKFLFGMLYINLLNLVWFWSRIWAFYKFWNFKSWGFWCLHLSMLILILHLKCFLFRFMWFFVFLLKAMIFCWLIICLD